MGTYDNMTIEDDTTSVTIDVTSDEEILSKTINSQTPAQSTNNYGSGKKDTILIDLMQIEERISIGGELSTESGTNATAKKANLITLFKKGGVLSTTYEGSTFNANFEKLSIKMAHHEGVEPEDGETGYTVKFTMIKGVNIGGA